MRSLSYYLFIFCLLICLGSCAKEQDSPSTPNPFEQSNCSIEGEIVHCPLYNSIDKQDVAGQKVELYYTESNARSGINLIDSTVTNENGWFKFFDLDCGEGHVVKIEFDEYGTYLDRVHRSSFFSSGFTPMQITPMLDIETRPNMTYDFDDRLEPIIKHISFQYPTVGQESEYLFFFNEFELNFDAEPYYNGTDIIMRIEDQFDENTFLVAERASNSIKFSHIWKITNDSLFISRYDNFSNEFKSILWNFEESDFPSGQYEYVVPLQTTSTNFVDMNQTYQLPVPAWRGLGRALDYSMLDFDYENLLACKKDIDEDGYKLQYHVFNKKDGLVRFVRFGDDGFPSTLGYDLNQED